MSELLPNHVAGGWVHGTGPGVALIDPVLGDTLVRVDAGGIDLASAFAFAREVGGTALRALTCRERGELLGAIARVLQSHREAYDAIACANSGTVKSDSAVDIDGAIYTVSTYARMAARLGDTRHLIDGEAVRLGKDESFQSQHVQVPTRGVALFINAFNFPAWGLWEKAAPALLSGVPVIVKPATATAWLTQRMVKDVIDAGILPAGALSVICGSSAGLLDALQPFDLVSFTGSADTAAIIRQHPAIARRSVRVNIEADSVNSAILMPGDAPGSPTFDAFVKEVAREMTVKSGQKCTAIRRAFVPVQLHDAAAEAIAARLAKTVVGNPRNSTVRMGALVNRAQYDAVRAGIEQLAREGNVIHDGAQAGLVDADPTVACCVGPTLLGVRDPDAASLVHDIEVFGPVATLMPYRDTAHAAHLARRGEGSLVVSLYGPDEDALARMALDLADSHGRVHVVSPSVAALHTGHGNVMPQSMHGGPGRAGGGEELGGLRALGFYHRRAVVQGAPGVITSMGI